MEIITNDEVVSRNKHEIKCGLNENEVYNNRVDVTFMFNNSWDGHATASIRFRQWKDKVSN